MEQQKQEKLPLFNKNELDILIQALDISVKHLGIKTHPDVWPLLAKLKKAQDDSTEHIPAD